MGTTRTTLDETDKAYEIVNGIPEEKSRAGARHGGVGGRLSRRVGTFVETHRLGEVYGPDTTFMIGQNERLPDMAFVAVDRIPATGEPDGAWPLAPDLAVEIVSPHDIYRKVLGKVEEYFGAGVRQVWLIDPEANTVMVFHTTTRITVLTADDVLTCDEVLPGFRCPLRDIFQGPGRPTGPRA